MANYISPTSFKEERLSLAKTLNLLKSHLNLLIIVTMVVGKKVAFAFADPFLVGGQGFLPQKFCGLCSCASTHEDRRPTGQQPGREVCI